MDHFSVAEFGAQFAYTVDGGELGEIEYENFNAASATLQVHGLTIFFMPQPPRCHAIQAPVPCRAG